MPSLNIADKSTVIMYEKKGGEAIARMQVISYDKIHNSITVDGDSCPLNDNQRVFLLLLGDEIIECMGQVRKLSVHRTRDISIYNARVKEERGAVRHKLNAPAVIENMLNNGRLIPLKVPIMVTVENLSASGVLILAPKGSLDLKSSFQLKLKLLENVLLINTSVVRLVSEGERGNEYGCSFLSVDH